MLVLEHSHNKKKKPFQSMVCVIYKSKDLKKELKKIIEQIYNFLGIFLISRPNFLPISKPLSKSSSVAPP